MALPASVYGAVCIRLWRFLRPFTGARGQADVFVSRRVVDDVLWSDVLTPPPPRTEWTRRVLHPVLIGHAASLSGAYLVAHAQEHERAGRVRAHDRPAAQEGLQQLAVAFRPPPPLSLAPPTRPPTVLSPSLSPTPPKAGGRACAARRA
jgi:hypothetical protein